MKLQVISLDSSKGSPVIMHDDLTCINLNSLIRRKGFDKLYILNQLGNYVDILHNVNLTNLASLCYKLKIDYSSFDCLDLVMKIIDILRSINSNICFKQLGISNQGETDLLPFDSLVEFDKNDSIIYMNRIIKDKLKVLGYAESQFVNVLSQVKDITSIIPKDMLKDIPLVNESTMQTYQLIKETLY